MKLHKIPITNADRLADDLVARRKEQQLTQQNAADRAGLSRRTAINAEQRKNVGLHEFCRLANALGMEVVLRPARAVVFEELHEAFPDE